MPYTPEEKELIREQLFPRMGLPGKLLEEWDFTKKGLDEIIGQARTRGYRASAKTLTELKQSWARDLEGLGLPVTPIETIRKRVVDEITGIVTSLQTAERLTKKADRADREGNLRFAGRLIDEAIKVANEAAIRAGILEFDRLSSYAQSVRDEAENVREQITEGVPEELFEGMGAAPVLFLKTIQKMTEVINEQRDKLLFKKDIPLDEALDTVIQMNVAMAGLERMSRLIPGFEEVVAAIRPQVDGLTAEVGRAIKTTEGLLGALKAMAGLGASIGKLDPELMSVVAKKSFEAEYLITKGDAAGALEKMTEAMNILQQLKAASRRPQDIRRIEKKEAEVLNIPKEAVAEAARSRKARGFWASWGVRD